MPRLFDRGAVLLVVLMAVAGCEERSIIEQGTDKQEDDVAVKSPEQHLFEAIGNNDAGGITKLIEDGLDLQQGTGDAWDQSTLGADALSSAVASGAVQAAQALLDAGVSPDATSHGKGVLYQAATAGQYEAFRLIVEAGVDLGSDETAWAAEHAASNGRTDMLRLLVQHGYDVNLQPDRESWTPLLAAAAGGHAETVRYLLEQGADPGRTTIRRNKDGTVDLLTARSVAVEAEHQEVVELLDRLSWGQSGASSPST